NYNVGYSTAIYDDLGSGVNYGDFVVSVAGSHLDVLDFSLNANALADLNTAIGNRDTYFSIGGTLLPGQGGVIPEPITFVVWLLLGFCGLGIARYRMRCRADS
ncbi:MAG: hypothetical protein JW829_03140, partial [Pirellulales bacterium]|nr:hypothetical protein [Pirellulales bacterium]